MKVAIVDNQGHAMKVVFVDKFASAELYSKPLDNKHVASAYALELDAPGTTCTADGAIHPWAPASSLFTVTSEHEQALRVSNSVKNADKIARADKMSRWLAQDPEMSDVKIETPPKLATVKRHCPLHVGALK